MEKVISKDGTPIAYEKSGSGPAVILVDGGSACLFGISSGAILALLAAASGLRVTRLALFEPPFVGDRQGRMPENPGEALQSLIAKGKKGNAVTYYLRKIMGLPAIIAFILRLTPNWPKMKANANSLPYDAAVCGDFNVPKEQAASVHIPTIVIDSEKSPKMLRDAVQAVTTILPNAIRKTLKGKVHDVPPKILAPVLTDFYTRQ